VNQMSSVVTPTRFAEGLTFDQYTEYIGSPENLRRQWDGCSTLSASTSARCCGSTTSAAESAPRRSGGAPRRPG